MVNFVKTGEKKIKKHEEHAKNNTYLAFSEN